MKKTLNLLSVTALALIIGFTACNKQVDQNPTQANAQSTTTKNNVANRNPDPFVITSDDIQEFPILGTIRNTQPLASNYDFEEVVGGTISFYFRWGPGCHNALGVCIGGNTRPGPREPLLTANINVNDGTIGSGSGDGNVFVLSPSKVLIFPDQNIAMADNTVPITADIVLSPHDAELMGYNSFKINAGRYMLHGNYESENFGHGYIIADCVAQ